ncbi:MAG: sugar ABC transporter permease [Clostridiales bacterium]|nr:sugar ABC transporter permease [Clostridiales bacterium]
MVKRTDITKLRKGWFKKYWIYYAMFLPGGLFLLLFNYVPMGGLVLAFKDYWPKHGMFGSPWAEPFYKNFAVLFEDVYFWTVVKNTLIISVLRFATSFPFTIFVALLFNELRSKTFSKFVQTILFIPYFISWVIISGIVKKVFGADGMVDTMLNRIGISGISFMSDDVPFMILLIAVDIWKGVGYGMVLYIASMSAINYELYEAVEIDGGNRLTKMLHVTLPGLKLLISMQLVMSFSGILNGGFDQIYNMYSVPVRDVADILDTYLFRISFGEEQDHSLSTAVGLFKSVIGFVLILAANKVSNKLNEESVL